MARGALMLNRAQLLRALPKHALLAFVCGAVAGVILYFLQGFQLDGKWNLLTFIPMAAVFVNAAMLPVIIPGRHWSFGFIGAVMLFLLLFAGLIISSKLPLPHSRTTLGVLQKVNYASYALILAGGCLGLFYGLLAGKRAAMVVGLAFGCAMGYTLGMNILHLVVGIDAQVGSPVAMETWGYNAPYHAAWILGVALTSLHLAAGAGAALGSGPPAGVPEAPQSKD